MMKTLCFTAVRHQCLVTCIIICFIHGLIALEVFPPNSEAWFANLIHDIIKFGGVPQYRTFRKEN